MDMQQQQQQQQLQSPHSPLVRGCRPPRLALASAFSTFVVRVHTRHGIKTLSFDALAAFFTSTAKKAAEELGISSRTLIRVCRSLGIRRWPYLGFRSEKNVERIRQEAVDNLWRRVEKRGAGAQSPADAVLYPEAVNHRGASAKRLLQVKLHHNDHDNTHATTVDLTGSCSGSEDDELLRASFDDSDASAALVTPLAAAGGFRFDLQRISPRKDSSGLQSAGKGPEPLQRRLQPRAPAQSLSLLVDASLSTALARPASPQLPRLLAQPPQGVRSMSMRDILASSALATEP